MFAEVMREDAYQSYRIRLESLLGIPRNACDQDVHKMIEAGFPTSRLKELYDLGMISTSERDQIIALRTLKARTAGKKRLTLHESDRLFRYVHITAMAEVLFGDKIKAKRWLSKPKDRFAGRKPLEMLSTFPGTREVEVMLIRVAEPFAF
ncbi:antitoxin Xre/MbcA/ParS toxin-binding domain-containing protein [Pseudomonas sp. SJZ080]|uniref:antitoxin Xre/MbcA/ParS toxin-binding domain-containing protein n=1 Tax=Pseudomonas sp. SJZ080 TaxID=2572888 RepID=UPI0011A15EF2|nr:antitoxin Xre/MbcA/ParS toxin-binding domain-containing protein [Pseudomonas sp. SJZ080]